MTHNTQPAVMAGNSTGWVRVSRELLCPICGRDHNCQVSSDGQMCWCGREEAGSIRTNDGGQYLHRLTEGDARGDDMPAEHAEWLERQRGNESRPMQASEPRREIEATYGYTDENSQLLYQVVRFNPKGFRQRQPDGDGGWKWSLEGVRRVLYRLPQIVSRPDDMVFILEGEKDCDAGQGIGLLATTSAQGAGSAKLTDWTPLAGRRVAIIPDNDESGEEYAEAVIEQLRALKPQPETRVLRLTGLPPKGDLSDWLVSRDSKSAEELTEGLIQEALRQPVVGKRLQLLDMTEPTDLDPAVIDGLLRVGETCNIIAPAKSGKSWLSYGIGFSVLFGLDWLGHQCQRGDVLLIDNELKGSTLRHRLYQVYCSLHRQGTISGSWESVRERIKAVPVRGKLLDINTLADALIAEIEAGQYKLVILDALYRLLPSGVSENDNAALTAIYNRLDTIAESLEVAIVVIHHSSKGNQAGKSVTDIGAGAGAISRAADSHLALRQHETNGIFVLDSALRSFAPSEPMCATFEWPLWRVADGFDPNKLQTATPGESLQDKDQAALSVLQSQGKPCNMALLRAELGNKSGDDVRGRMLRLHSKGLVEMTDKSTGTVLSEYPDKGYVLFEAVEPAEPIASGDF